MTGAEFVYLETAKSEAICGGKGDPRWLFDNCR